MANTLRTQLAVFLAAVLLASGCAHGVSRKTRIARVLVGVGAATAVVGGLVAAGCVDSNANGPDGCSGGPGDADLAAGIPIMAVGAGLIVGGLLMREKDGGRLLPKPGSLQGPVPLNQPVPY